MTCLPLQLLDGGGQWASALVGLAVGLLQALAGAGGGILGVPLLVFAQGWSVQQAAPVALVGVALSALLAAVLALQQGQVRYRAALFMGAVGMVTAPLGLLLAQRLPGRVLLGLFFALMVFTARRALHNTRPAAIERAAARAAVAAAGTGTRGRPALCARAASDGRFVWTRACTAALTAIGAVAGFLSGLLGVGGGFVILPALQQGSDLDWRSAQATSLAVIALVASAATVSAALHGVLPWAHAAPFVGGALVGTLAGRHWAGSIAPRRLQQAFALTCAGVAVLLLMRLFGAGG